MTRTLNALYKRISNGNNRSEWELAHKLANSLEGKDDPEGRKRLEGYLNTVLKMKDEAPFSVTDAEFLEWANRAVISEASAYHSIKDAFLSGLLAAAMWMR